MLLLILAILIAGCISNSKPVDIDQLFSGWYTVVTPTSTSPYYYLQKMYIYDIPAYDEQDMGIEPNSGFEEYTIDIYDNGVSQKVQRRLEHVVDWDFKNKFGNGMSCKDIIYNKPQGCPSKRK